MHAPALRVKVSPSPLLAGALALAHGAAITCCVLFLPAWELPALASALLAGSLVFHVRRDAMQRSGHAITELVLTNGGTCELSLLNGDTVTGNIEGSTFVAPLLTVINVCPAGRGRRRAVVLLPDSAPGQDLRRVRVWLRYRVRPELPA